MKIISRNKLLTTREHFMSKRISSIKIKSLIYLVTTLFCVSSFAETFLKGADLSYVNQMESCGVTYKDNGVTKNNYQIMADHGANIVRIRLWHTPDWEAMDGTVNQFSDFADAKISIARAKALGLNVLLDFHYSDEWTDPGHQTIPSAWESLVNDTPALASTVYNYTYDTLISLNADGLMPEYVQVGNETNREIMMLAGSTGSPINWTRNSALLNAGISAVRAAGGAASIDPKIILHIADPNNAVWWFGDATENGVTDFDIIGLSYYPEWHPGTITQTGDILTNLKTTFNKDVMIVETGVIWTHDWNDNGTNMMGSEQYYVSEGYGVASPEAQRDWLIDLANEVKTRGGLGVVYWEPSWVSNGCWTLWGEGSHWENASFFDFNNNLNANGGIKFLEENYGNVTFKVDMTGVKGADGGYITGDFTGSPWQIMEMRDYGNNIYSFSVNIPEGSTGGYYFLKRNSWGKRETVPTECALSWGTDREYSIPQGQGGITLAFNFASCD